jgi:hypothetical protein
MKYKAYLKQEGYGCDYTIACGINVIDITANNIDEATEQVSDYIFTNYCEDVKLESCEIYEINQIVKIDLVDIYNKKRLHDEEIELYKIELDELKKYQELKAKYGN